MAQRIVDSRYLRSALEFAVVMAREGQKLKPPLKYPAPLKRYFGADHLPSSALPAIQRAIEADDDYRRRIAVGATAELVDEVGLLWLRRPPDWETELAAAVARAERAEADADLERQLRRSEQRRVAAERATARTRAELVVLTEQAQTALAAAEAADARADGLTAQLGEVREELVQARLETRHAHDRESAALARVDAAQRDAEAARSAQRIAEQAESSTSALRDAALADRAWLAAERADLAEAAESARQLAARLASMLGSSNDAAESRQPDRQPDSQQDRSAERRRALAMPGGVLGSSRRATEFLLRSGSSVIVDGYNVAKLAWPDDTLIEQRERLTERLENVARQFGADIVVIFDGADVVGASAPGRRLVRVAFSPADRIADDVIRDEVARLPVSRSVVVVTNDAEIVRDVRARGANVLSSDQLIDLWATR